MDLLATLGIVTSSGIVSVAAAHWLAGRLVDHRLTKDLKNHQESIDKRLLREKETIDRSLQESKAQWDERLTVAKAEVEAALRRQVEGDLGDAAAERQYRLDARKRLYGAIGPLRFQLIIACAEFANRVDRIGSGSQSYQTSLDGYFGRSTVFRLLRLFAITELVERQVSQADFSVDPSTSSLLRFKQAAIRCMSSSTVTLGHPSANWVEQAEHVFHDTLSIIAAMMILTDPSSGIARAMRFDEFSSSVMDQQWRDSLHPIPQLFEGFSPEDKPILWIRLVALARICSAFVEREGPQVGIMPEPYDGKQMLRASGNDHIHKQLDAYEALLEDLVAASRPAIVPKVDADKRPYSGGQPQPLVPQPVAPANPQQIVQ